MEGYNLETAIKKEKLPDYVLNDNLESRFSKNAFWTAEKKYLARNPAGEIIESLPERIYGISRAMAEVEERYGKGQEEIDGLTKQFYNMIASKEFSPGGRVWTNAGTEIKSLFNCYVLPVDDSLEEIYTSVKNAALIHKRGGGTGYNFSNIRPRGSYVVTSKGMASGVVSFIGQFDKETEIINSGNRRGANMGILDVDHPDILDFIYAKSEKGLITNFNISIGAKDAFMDAVKKGDYYTLKHKDVPFTAKNSSEIRKNVEENKIGGSEVGKKPEPPSLIIADNGKDILDTHKNRVIGRIDEQGYVQLDAKKLMKTIAELAWKTGDPGMIFLDEINRYNPLPELGPIPATNPCGEQPLHPYDACNLGSLNLEQMVTQSNGDVAVDYNKIKDVTWKAIRFMDNVNDANKGPIPEIEKTVLAHRRIGYGVMGWADMLVKLGIPYDSEKALSLAGEVMGYINNESKKASVALGEEKGVFPAFKGSIYDTDKLEDRVRNVERTTIAPTGTISMMFDVASGIEPFFAIIYTKQIRGGDSLSYLQPLLFDVAKKRGFYTEDLAAKIDSNHGSLQGLKEVPEDVQRLFRTSHDINYKWHVKMQAAFQKHVDNAVSKTINMPNSANVEDVESAYVQAWEEKLKGITVYRDGSKEIQVLVAGKQQVVVPEPVKLPAIMPSLRIRQITPFGNMHGHITVDPKTDREYEIFAQIGKGGDFVNADLEGICRLASMHLRSHGKLETIMEQLKGIGSSHIVPTKEGRINSLPDGIYRALKKYTLAKEKYGLRKLLLGEVDFNKIDEELSEMLKKGGDGEHGNHKSANNNNPIDDAFETKCPECSNGKLIHESGCISCSARCGYSQC